ncbi:putative transposase [Rhodobacter aestuarii]|uniref:Putative transposase n=2 Tax=Rhodobacter aestuarii TaxID=453582 RepID=A0A1N7Q2A9_9RHOB|nr:putative transposase [Rhodobacter aestuarii]SIT16982.1 putative transposase [Rhodobacter aestuarii]
MKDMVTRQEWFTARELAEAVSRRGLAGYPKSERNFRALAERQGWNEGLLARKRAGRGGGMEYHFSALPTDLQAALAGSEAKTCVVHAMNAQALREERQLDALRAAHQPKHAVGAREARAEITRAIDAFAVAKGQGRAWAIRAFLEAQNVHLARIAASEKIADHQPVTPAEAKLLQRPDPMVEGFGVTADTILTANARARGGIAKLSERSLWRWFQARDAGAVVALAPAPTKTVDPIPAGFAGFLKHYAIGTKPDATEALSEYLKTDPPEHLRLTISQVRYVLRNKLNDIERNVGREGLLTLRSRMAYIERSTENLLPTTVYTADGKTFDAEIADPRSRLPMRPELTSILDVATRKCVGIAVSRKENVIAVTEALRRACENHGIPAMFYTDRGAGYKNKTFDTEASGLMARLSITKMHALPYNSQAKGIIERFNKTVWNPLSKRFPTYIGADMDKEASQFAHRKTRRDIKEFGESRLLMPWEEFLDTCERAVAEYNDRPHSALPRFEDPETGTLRHMSPNEAWAAHVRDGFEALLPDPGEIDDLFRPYEVRVVRRGLVEWNRNTFFHERLEAYHGVRVLVGYDDNQAEHVWVREIADDGEPGPLICVARFGGNRTDFIPRTLQDKVERDRLEGRKKRVQAKLRDIEAEAAAPLIVERPVEPVANFIREPQAPEAVRANVPLNAAKKPRFASDLDLALWAIEHPGEASDGQMRILRDCMNQPTSVEYFRSSGVDLDALAKLLRGAA